jgi:hypothetical protein
VAEELLKFSSQQGVGATPKVFFLGRSANHKSEFFTDMLSILIKQFA